MIKYTVIENQRKVIARIDGCENDVLKIIKKKSGIEFDAEGLKLRGTYKGVAKCSPEDEFNIEEGKRIARERMLCKYNKSYNKSLEIAKDILYSFYNEVSEIEFRNNRI